ncbi:hypothetical protein AB3331_04535 [Streptococcus sp. H49]|uniref:hypothetical protein n=1 Tax=Streptococcus huangxiaojuni TaxID=3237239 RepID=UPI0034A59723
MKTFFSGLIVGTALVVKGKIVMKKFTYVFKKEHQIVKSWVSLVLSGTYKLEEVPALFNLREVVIEVLTEQEEAESEGES